MIATWNAAPAFQVPDYEHTAVGAKNNCDFEPVPDDWRSMPRYLEKFPFA